MVATLAMLLMLLMMLATLVTLMMLVTLIMLIMVSYLTVHSCLMAAVSGVQQQCGLGGGSMREDVFVARLNGLLGFNIYTQASFHWSKNNALLRGQEAK